VRSAVLSVGFGAGVAVMAILLGVADVVLQQAQAPALVGGGDVVIRLSPETPARLVLSGTLQADALRERVRVAAPFHTTDLMLLADGPHGEHGASAAAAGSTRTTAAPRPIRVAARGGIPSLERALGDPETGGVAAWRDSAVDVAWTHEPPDRFLRAIDRFHPIPDAPLWEDSWAEWLYFNGRGPEGRFYLTFLVGSRTASGRRAASVFLQLEHRGRMATYSDSAELTDDDVASAPDLRIGGSGVRLDGMRYHLHVDLTDGRGERVAGTLTLDASPGQLVPPLEVAGAHGWRTGYVVPVLSGLLGGSLAIADDVISFDGEAGYHDHNWGFWAGVTWQWGQLQHEDLSLIFGRIFPPPEAADAERLPGLVGVLGPDGPIGFATDVRITETNDAAGRPETLTVRGKAPAFELTLRFRVESMVSTEMAGGPLAGQRSRSPPGALEFLQMRGVYTVSGHVGDREIALTAPGSAETFRGRE
jgi:hypothetical protein